jgi:hypothetical protein
MKESEFIELLNLYLDHEISVADAARLEAEVQANPSRRRIYQQYCRMQKACALAAADFQVEPQVAAEIAKKVIPFNAAAAGVPHRKQASSFYTIGAFAAAAACVAIIFVGRSRQHADDAVTVPPASFAQNAALKSAAPMPVAGATASSRGLVSVAPAPGSSSRAGTMLVADPLLLTSTSNAGATLTNAGQSQDQLAWITAVQLTPLQQRVPADDLRFDIRPATLRPEGRALGGTRVISQPEDELAAFRFVK